MYSAIIPPLGAGGASQARNPQRTYEKLTTGSADLLLLTGGTANVLGSPVAIATPANDLAGVLLTFAQPSSNALRGQLTLRDSSNSNILIEDYHVQPGGNANGYRVFIPKRVAALTPLDIALRTSGASGTMRFNVKGVVDNALDAPGYSLFEPLGTAGSDGISTGQTRPNVQNIVLDGNWQDIMLDTGPTAYAAFHMVADIVAAPTTAQRVYVELGIGAPGSEVVIGDLWLNLGTASPYVIGGYTIDPIYATIPANSRLRVRPTPAVSTNTDQLRIGAWGFA